MLELQSQMLKNKKVISVDMGFLFFAPPPVFENQMILYSLIFFCKPHFSGTRDTFLSAQMLVFNIVKGLKYVILAQSLSFK